MSEKAGRQGEDHNAQLPIVDFSRDILAHQAKRLLVLRDTGSGWADLSSPNRVLRDGFCPGVGIPSILPPELRRLFTLSSVDRQCFVLRMLMGLTPQVTSEILNLYRDEVDEALCRALRDLPRGEQISGEQNGWHN